MLIFSSRFASLHFREKIYAWLNKWILASAYQCPPLNNLQYTIIKAQRNIELRMSNTEFRNVQNNEITNEVLKGLEENQRLNSMFRLSKIGKFPDGSGKSPDRTWGKREDAFEMLRSLAFLFLLWQDKRKRRIQLQTAQYSTINTQGSVEYRIMNSE